MAFLFGNLQFRATMSLLVAMLLTASTSFTAMIKVAIDVSLVGKLGSSELAAFTFVFPIIFLIMSAGRGIYIATAGVFSGDNYINDRHVYNRPVILALIVSLSLGLLVGAFMYCALPVLMHSMGAFGHQGRIDDYFSVWLWTIPMMFISANTFAIARNLGYLKIASSLTFIATAVGVIFSWLLIPHDFGSGPLGIVGSAYSTLITSSLSTSLSLAFIFYCSKTRLNDKPQDELSAMTWRILSVGFPVFLSTILQFIFMSFTTRIFSGFGQDSIAAYGIIGRIEQILFVFQTAFVTVAIPTLIRRFSEGDYDRAKKFIASIVRLMLIVGVGLALILFFLRATIVEVAAPSAASRAICIFYLTFIAVTNCFQGIFLLAATSLNLLGKANKALLWCFLNYCVVSPGTLFLFSTSVHVDACLLGLAFSNVLSGSVAWYCISAELRNKYGTHSKTYSTTIRNT
jgi:Na+-driven multidrug efflux pump